MAIFWLIVLAIAFSSCFILATIADKYVTPLLIGKVEYDD